MPGYRPKPSFAHYNMSEGRDEDLIGAWPFIEGTGSTVYDYSGRAGQDGVTSHSPTWEGSPFGYALNFNNTGPDYMTANGMASLVDVTEGSIWIWAKFRDGSLSTDGNNHNIFQIGVNADSNNQIQIATEAAGTARVAYIEGGTTYAASLGSSTIFDDWCRVVCAWDSSNIYAYANGKLINTTTRSSDIAVTLDRVVWNIAAHDLTSNPGGFIIVETRVSKIAPDEIEVARDYHDSFELYRPGVYLGHRAKPEAEAVILGRVFVPAQGRVKQDAPTDFSTQVDDELLREDASVFTVNDGSKFSEFGVTPSAYDGDGVYLSGWGIDLLNINEITGIRLELGLDPESTGTYHFQLEWKWDVNTLNTFPDTLGQISVSRIYDLDLTAGGVASYYLGGPRNVLDLDISRLDMSTIRNKDFGLVIRHIADPASGNIDYDFVKMHVYYATPNPLKDFTVKPINRFARQSSTGATDVSKFTSLDNPDSLLMAIQSIAKQLSKLASSSVRFTESASGETVTIAGGGEGGNDLIITSTDDPQKGIIVFGDKSPANTVIYKQRWTYNENLGVWGIPFLSADPDLADLNEHDIWFTVTGTTPNHRISLKVFEGGAIRELAGFEY